MFIYKIENLINNKIYIGQTVKTIEHRYKGHLKNADNNKEHPLYDSMNKHGINSFKLSEIEQCTSIEELNLKETYWINYFKSQNRQKGYNLNTGGKNGFHCKETRLKIGKANKGKKRTEETKLKLSLAHKGAKLSEEHKRKIGKTLIGRKHSEEAKKKMRKRVFSEETRKKMSLSRKKLMTSEFKLKMNKHLIGKKHSKKTKRKMSLSAKKRMTPEFKLKLSIIAKKAMTPERKKRISKALTGRKQSKETIEKRNISLKEGFKKGRIPWNKGKFHTERAKKKMSISGKKIWIFKKKNKFREEN